MPIMESSVRVYRCFVRLCGCANRKIGDLVGGVLEFIGANGRARVTRTLALNWIFTSRLASASLVQNTLFPG